MPESTGPRPREILGFQITRAPRGPRKPWHLPALMLAVGLGATAFHEFTYRKTGGDDFELNGIISHAGTDMILLLGLLLAVVLIYPGRQR